MQTSRTFRSHFKNPKATRANVRSSAGYGIGSAKMALKILSVVILRVLSYQDIRSISHFLHSKRKAQTFSTM